ncbi:MAG TPA: hypothetical protein VHC69_05760 [Polyangiaceae bacterium]|nr:hypothetical protein [Polyangiaceae bacterium]
MRSPVIAVTSCLLAAACSQLLGIDGQYERDQEGPAAGGRLVLPDAATGGAVEPPPISAGSAAAGGSGGQMQMPVLQPPEMIGTPPPVLPPRERDAGRSLCQPGFKICGEVCTPMTPATGCAAPTCNACNTPANSHTSCSADGACESICDAGFVPAGSECVPQKATGGAGGREGAGDAPPDAGENGGAPSDEPCDPLKCPACNRGFEGCCIPPAPDGTPSRCGCFYFPPLCTARVG